MSTTAPSSNGPARAALPVREITGLGLLLVSASGLLTVLCLTNVLLGLGVLCAFGIAGGFAMVTREV